eukprot:5478779-Prymnesium_polylepis.1
MIGAFGSIMRIGSTSFAQQKPFHALTPVEFSPMPPSTVEAIMAHRMRLVHALWEASSDLNRFVGRPAWVGFGRSICSHGHTMLSPLGSKH